MMFSFRIYCICLSLLAVVAYCQIDSKINFLYNGVANRTQSKECFDILKKIPTNGSLPFWAIQMLDSMGKLQSGILAGNTMTLGDYDQCIRIADEGAGVRGKYCIASYKYVEEAPFILGVCLPDVCNLGAFLPGKEYQFYTRDDLCQTLENTWTAADVACILLILSSILLIITAAGYELYKIKHNDNNVNRTLMAFSVFANTKKLFTINPSELSCLYGIRVFSMMWIMYGHRVSIMATLPTTNALELLYDIKLSNAGNYIYAANFAVDTFFYISGFLVAYIPLREGYRLKKEYVSRFILHRFFRILPTIIMLFFILVTISRRVGSGPFYKLGIENARLPCVTHWWSYFFFIQNYVNFEYPCLTQTWYLSVDVQMYCLSPLVLIPMGKWFVNGEMWKVHSMFGALISFFIMIPIVLDLDIINGYATHDRIAVYLVGIYAGVNALEVGWTKFPLSKVWYYITWCLVLIVMVVIAYFARYMIVLPTTKFSVLLATFGRPIWGVCLTWIIYNCMYHRCALINNLLSLPIFEVLSRLTFSMYVLHNFVIGYHSISLRNSLYLSDKVFVQFWMADLVITVAFAYIWSMLYEVPLIQLDKLIFGVPPRKNRKFHHDAEGNYCYQKIEYNE